MEIMDVTQKSKKYGVKGHKTVKESHKAPQRCNIIADSCLQNELKMHIFTQCAPQIIKVLKLDEK